jgi:hypothetical protein
MAPGVLGLGESQTIDENWASDTPASIDFLSEPSFRLFNAQVDEHGKLVLPLTSFSPHHSHIDIIVFADDREGTSVSRARFPLLPLQPQQAISDSSAMEGEAKQQDEISSLSLHYKDIRYFPPTGPSSNATLVPVVELQRVTVLLPSTSLTIADWGTATVSGFYSLDDLFYLLHTLTASHSPTISAAMDAFAFVLKWNSFTEAEKHALYSEFACHELDFFLYQRDRPFFTAVVLPFLRQRMQPAVFDLLLKGDDVSRLVESGQWLRLHVIEQILLASHSAEQGNLSLARRIFHSIEQRVQAQSPQPLDEAAARFNIALMLNSISRTIGDSADHTEQISSQSDESTMEEDLDREDHGCSATEMCLNQAKEKRLHASETHTRSTAAPAPFPTERNLNAVHAVAMSSSALASQELRPTFVQASMCSMATAMAQPRRLYVSLPTTKEYQERNYWGESPQSAAMQPERVTPGALWGDYAAHCSRALSEKTNALFLSSQLTDPTGSFTEVMAALSVVALPFASAHSPPSISHPTSSSLQINAVGPTIVFHQERVPASQSEKQLISATAHYFDPRDRYVDFDPARWASTSSIPTPAFGSDFGRQSKLLTEFTTGRAYTCCVALFNPSAIRVKVRVMQQVPEGAVSVGGGVDTRTRTLHLNAFTSLVIEFSFYFPRIGSFAHQAVQVSDRDVVIGYTDPVMLSVTAKVALAVDATSWSYIASFSTDSQVLDFLELSSTNVHALDWTLLAWRWRIRYAFWRSCVRIALERLVFDPLLLAYSLHHQDVDVLRIWLPTIPTLVTAVGSYFVSTILRVDAELAEFDQYKHLEYRPLIASRAHTLNTAIQNRELRSHWVEFLTYISFRYSSLSQWTTPHRLQLCYLLLLQERVDDAMLHFRDVQKPITGSDGLSLHYDYMAAYLLMYTKPSAALTIAKRYYQYPLIKQRNLFDAIAKQVNEVIIDRMENVSTDPQRAEQHLQGEDANSRDSEMDALAAMEPSLDFTVTSEGVLVTYANVKQLTLSVHVIDLEPMFSSRPFGDADMVSSTTSSSFLYLAPNYEERIDLPPSLPSAIARRVLSLPPQLRQSNLLVSLRAGTVLLTRPCYAHGLAVMMMEALGQLKVTARSKNDPLANVYIKVYARENEGDVSFYKDGYTDWRGRFDYASLSTDRLSKVDEFAILVHSEEEGAVIRQAKPPGKSR